MPIMLRTKYAPIRGVAREVFCQALYAVQLLDGPPKHFRIKDDSQNTGSSSHPLDLDII